MSTNSLVGVVCEDGVRGVYVHWDGYEDGVGHMLRDNYTDFMKVCELINNGDISVLAERVNPIGMHSFSNPKKVSTICNSKVALFRQTNAKLAAPQTTPPNQH